MPFSPRVKSEFRSRSDNMSDSGSISGAQPPPGADDEFDYGMGANNEALAAMRHGLPTAISGVTTNACLDCLLFVKKIIDLLG